MALTWQSDELGPWLRWAQRRGEDPTEPLTAIGVYMEGRAQEVIEEQGDPPGSFAPLSDAYADYKKKKGKGDQILVFDSILINSLTSEVDGWTVVWGTNKPYAARMHFGWKDETPAREFVVEPNEDDRETIEEILVQWMLETKAGEA